MRLGVEGRYGIARIACFAAIAQSCWLLHKQSLEMFHHDRDVIKLGKQRVFVLAIIGLAVESFLALAYHSRRGFDVLRWFNVKSVTFRKCSVNGVNKTAADVEVDRTMAERALRIARAIAERLGRFGFRLLDAIVPEYDSWKVSVGEHDLIGDRKGLTGKSSVEVKLRTIQKDHYVETVRKQVRAEAYHGTSKRFWTTAIEKPQHEWAERVVVMVVFASPLAETFDIVCEALPAASLPTAANWSPLFGWPSVKPPAPAPPTRVVAAVPKGSPRTRPAATASSADGLADRQRKRKIDELYSKVRRYTVHEQEMGSVSDFLNGMAKDGKSAAKRAKPTLGEKMPRWKARFTWPAYSYVKSPKFRSLTGGGKEGYGATKAAPSDMYRQLE